jgi:hypothetical protein
MRDENDFFDDLIDDEAETYTSEASDEDDFEGDDDEEDDEEFETRTAVLSKKGMLALLTVKTNEDGGQIVRVDPRQQLPTAQRYDTPESAIEWFRRSLATSRRNGWEVVYDGVPAQG